MINDENRREVAAIIRDMFKYECKYKVEFFDLLRDALDQEFDIVLGFDNMAEILADLIDRPTCKPKDRGRGYVDAVCDSFWCPNCSFEIDVHIGEEQHLTEAAKYCPNCGAEVVE